jgi:hypothetical protein
MTGTQILVLILIAAAFATGWSARGHAEREREGADEAPPDTAPEPAPAPAPAPAPRRTDGRPEVAALGAAIAAWDRARRDPAATPEFSAAAATVDDHAERLESADYDEAANALAGLQHLLRDRTRLRDPATQAALAGHQRALADAYARVISA